MKVKPLSIDGVFLIEGQLFQDSRGTFHKLYSSDLFGNRYVTTLGQINISKNPVTGTIRGLHVQSGNATETKIVSAVTGEIFDVFLDLRRNSTTYGKWGSVILKDSQNALVLPPGVAHGFQTLIEDCVLQYVHSGIYSPEVSIGVRYDDPDLKIPWPNKLTRISEADRSLPFFKEFSGI